VEVETARRAQALVVPVDALRGDDPAAAAVWLAREGRVEARPVRLGLRTLEFAEVLDGLAAGDAVLVGPAPAPGQRVRADLQAATASRARGGARQDAGAALTNAMGR
jgi:HlyD family secretion protein